MDKYQIIGGDELIDKISEGIESSDKFLIFLSSSSIEKPWVKAELRKAMMKELKGINPDFIIPIKLGNISSYPLFLESRYYIDLESKTMNEWLSDMHSAITREPKPFAQQEDNLTVNSIVASDNSNVAILIFRANFWAEDISFKVTTRSKIEKCEYRLPELKVHIYHAKVIKEETVYAVKMENHKIERSKSFQMVFYFENTDDPRKEIDKIEKWDGLGGFTEFLRIFKDGRTSTRIG